MWCLYDHCLAEFLNVIILILSMYSKWDALAIRFVFCEFLSCWHASLSPDHFPPCSSMLSPECVHRTLFPDALILLALVEILHITKLHVVTASMQFSVCDIFTWVHAHGYGSCLLGLQLFSAGGCKFSWWIRWENVVAIDPHFGKWTRFSLLPPSFGEMKLLGFKNRALVI